MLEGKTILILGGTGTLGNALLDEFLKYDIHAVRIFARSEYRFFDMKQRYGEPTGKIRYFIGDIKDKDRLNSCMKGVDICINCAAMKHVSFCESSPHEAVMTNVIGTQNAVDCAIENNVEAFIQISTDKAVNPTNTYGRTKALAEDITLNASQWQGNTKTRFIVVRSGNIKNSSGSVFEIWDRQIKEGKPLTVTDLQAERYMASKEDISKTIVGLLNMPTGLYVLKMPKYTVKELLPKNYPFKIVGLQKGEKLVEEMYSEDEIFEWVEVVLCH